MPQEDSWLSQETAWQRHHDHYVTAYLRGELTGKFELRQYQIAIDREKRGQVKPLPEMVVKPNPS